MLTKIVAQDYKAWRSNANAFSAAVKAEMQGAAKFGVCAIETTTAQVRSSEVAERAGRALYRLRFAPICLVAGRAYKRHRAAENLYFAAFCFPPADRGCRGAM